jgi:hypothetical protein
VSTEGEVSEDDVKATGSKGSKGGEAGASDGGRAGPKGRGTDRQPGAQVASLVMAWIAEVQASEGEYREAELDRASFESFPASDPVAPATASQGTSALRLECVVSDDRLTFCRTPRSDDAASPGGGAPQDRLEFETADGLRVVVVVRRSDDEDPGREPLELPHEHASIEGREDERRSGDDRRTDTDGPQGGRRDERRSGNERRTH